MPIFFDDFCKEFPERVDERILVTDLYPLNHPVDATVRVDTALYIGRVKNIGSNCLIESGVVIEDGVTIGRNVVLENDTRVLKNVSLSSDLSILSDVFIFEGARVVSARRIIPHDYGRTIHNGTIIGPGVTVPGEVQVGPDAIIPTSKTIAQIGPFGSSSRMVTVNGSDTGPVYNVGCQKGIDLETFKDRILNAEETTKESADDYKRNLTRIVKLAEKTQAAYFRESGLISELIERVNLYDID